MLLQGVIVIMLLNQLNKQLPSLTGVSSQSHPRAPHEGRRSYSGALRAPVEESPPLFFGGGGEAACRPKRRGKKEVRQKQQQKKSFHSVGTEAELSIWEHDGHATGGASSPTKPTTNRRPTRMRYHASGHLWELPPFRADWRGKPPRAAGRPPSAAAGRPPPPPCRRRVKRNPSPQGSPPSPRCRCRKRRPSPTIQFGKKREKKRQGTPSRLPAFFFLFFC